jgi:hypothetical protein
MESLDLDINNYGVDDLVKFFRFTPTDVLTPSAIELRETETRELLFSTGHINKRFKRDLIAFLTEAKTVLIEKKCKKEAKPTIFQNRTSMANLDPYPDVPRLAPVPPRTDELNVRVETPFVNSFHSEYFAGNMNPLKTRIIAKNLNIDTRFRDYNVATNPSDFILALPQKVQKVVSMHLSALELPMTFYNISHKYGNNHFYLEVVTQHAGNPVQVHPFNIVVPDGNYTNSDLLMTINSQIVESPCSCIFDLSFNIDLNENRSGTGKVMVTSEGKSGNVVTNVKLDFIQNPGSQIDILQKLGWHLGFTKKIYDGVTSYVSETMPDSNRVRYLYLAIDDYNNSVNNNFTSAFHKSVLSPNILARISPGAVDSFGLFIGNELNMVTEPRKYFGPVDIQKLHIQVFDDMGRVIDLNGANFSFCLSFKVIYDL